ncbi:MAG: hypothetical protein A3C38_02365 [Planctomycetes bacterium RIFCSPHIGHO2_02_FULL_50_42]|nr:MAG: hypothetical protein A3C38_02365 [Planctomycetes bacterium RIFCSPHIGHO2_02_FULL_50_42]OHB95961.1 MAG: hypothetical protein A3I59_03290 [Planctomycetes bacterium RIFCSPLOWO2_02_FULL_50_16]OHC02423.1 MAG: hypothetical protein A3G17_05565 [Planctomycetes bacterium RIFCSPLOWO2_12_FULL_50_35]HCN20444.1 hypothetical protein [Planctomycetia bacterium]
MPDTFNPHYSWLETWKENDSPPIVFYSTTPNLVPEIEKVGLVPFSEGENFFIEGVHKVLAIAKRVKDKRSLEFAEILLVEHPERPRALHLTFNHYLAVQQAKKKARRNKALLWLYELFFEQLKKNLDHRPAETEIKELAGNYERLSAVQSANQGVIIHVGTDLKKFDRLPDIIEDKKRLDRAVKGKHPLCKIYGPTDKKWKKLSREEIEACIETMVRGGENFEGLGAEIITSEIIPPSDIVKIEPVQL